MEIQDRVIGIENEYGCAVYNSEKGEYLPPQNISNFLGQIDRQTSSHRELGVQSQSHEAEEWELEGYPNVNANRLWLSNGGCVYIDMSHPEYASPECRSVRDAVVYNKAGELLMCRILRLDDSSASDLKIFKHNVAKNIDPAESTPDVITFGCHENYLLWNRRIVYPSRENIGLSQIASSSDVQLSFALFLATRQIFDGAGMWTDSSDESSFELSQRAQFIYELTSQETTGKRAIINQREESHMALDSAMRLHLIVGDANMLEYALFLKLGTAALVLAMLENKEVPKLYAGNIVKAMRETSSSADPNAPVFQMEDKSRKSALEIQAAFCEAARRFLNSVSSFPTHKWEQDLKNTLAMWEKTLNALEHNDEQWMFGRIDYATKRMIARDRVAHHENATGSSDVSSAEIRSGIDLYYHSVEEDMMCERILRAKPECRIVSGKDIRRAVFLPPEDTRAYARGNIIAHIYKSSQYKISAVGWDSITVKELDAVDSDGIPYVNKGASPGSIDLLMKNPFSARPEGYAEFITRTSSSG